jgi:hypothetical protein
MKFIVNVFPAIGYFIYIFILKNVNENSIVLMILTIKLKKNFERLVNDI